MASVLDPDILEQILIHLDVKDLIRFKSVCKSWQSFISSFHFIKSHINHYYKIYYHNPKYEHRRMLISSLIYRYKFSYKVNDLIFDFNNCTLIGSCNGLICISPFDAQVLVANPSTREVRKLRIPRVTDVKDLCWGFGYDQSADDYKVVLGFKKDKDKDVMCFQTLTLRSDVWKDVGEVNFTSFSSVGKLCNGRIHWFMNDPKYKRVILCFDLCKEEFKEIPQPDDVRYECSYDTRLETIGGCLCVVFPDCCFKYRIWVMKKYDVKESWELFRYIPESCSDNARFLNTLMRMCERSFGHDLWFPNSLDDIGASIFVTSLVSPHVNGTLKRKRMTMINKRDKLIKGDASVPEQSA